MHLVPLAVNRCAGVADSGALAHFHRCSTQRQTSLTSSSMAVDLSLLAEVPIFRFLDDAERITLASLFEEQTFGIGETIFHGGEPGDDLFLVSAGRVDVFITSDTGDKIILAEATCGDVFGEISLL